LAHEVLNLFTPVRSFVSTMNAIVENEKEELLSLDQMGAEDVMV
jgi:hypothetical protein